LLSTAWSASGLDCRDVRETVVRVSEPFESALLWAASSCKSLSETSSNDSVSLPSSVFVFDDVLLISLEGQAYAVSQRKKKSVGNTVKPLFYMSTFCILHNFIHFLKGPSQMPIRTTLHFNPLLISSILNFTRIYTSIFPVLTMNIPIILGCTLYSHNFCSNQ